MMGPVWGQEALPLQEWVDVGARAAMGPQASRTDGVEPDYRAFSSMEATDDGRIIYWGGGHANYGGNDMDVYHVGANTWRQETQEENWKVDLDSWDHLGTNGQPTAASVEKRYRTGTVSDFLTGRGRPGTRHVYQQMAWWPEKGWFVFDFKHSLWAWDPDQGDANGSMMKINDTRANQGFADIFYWNIAHDPGSGSLISFNTADDSVYRLEDGHWRKVMDVPFGGNKGEVYSEYHAADGVHYVSRWNDVYIVDLARRTVTDIADTPPQLAGKNGPWLEYAPSREQMLVMGFDASGLGLWGYKPGDARWERIPMQGEVLRGDGQPLTNDDIRWDLLERDPVSGNFYFLAIDKGNPSVAPPIYAFRLAEDAGAPAAGDPSPHPANQWVTLPIPRQPAGLPWGSGKDFQMEWRDADGKVYICCGDWLQNDGVKHNGNEHLLGLDAESNTWSVEMTHCSGHPQPEGWDEVAVAYDSKRDELWGFPGFGWRTDDCDTDIGAKTMAYGFGTGEWRETGHGHLFPNDDIGFGDYDPVTDRFYVAERPGVDEIDPERPSAGIVASHSSGTDYHVSANQAFLDAVGRGFYLTANRRKKLVRFDMDRKSFREVSGIPEGTVASNAYGFWDPNHRVILAPVGRQSNRTGKVHVYHVDLARWQLMDFPDDGAVPFGNSVAYDVDSQLLLQLGGAYPELRQVFALEYAPQATGVVEPWVDDGTESADVEGELVNLALDAVPDSGGDVGLPDSGGEIDLSPPELIFSSSEPYVIVGDSVALSWEATRADRCSASGAWDGRRDLAGQSEIAPTNTGVQTYKLTCSNEVGDAVKSVELSVKCSVESILAGRCQM